MAIPLKSGLFDCKSAAAMGNPTGTLGRSLSMLSMTSSPRKKSQRYLALYDLELQIFDEDPAANKEKAVAMLSRVPCDQLQVGLDDEGSPLSFWVAVSSLPAGAEEGAQGVPSPRDKKTAPSLLEEKLSLTAPTAAEVEDWVEALASASLRARPWPAGDPTSYLRHVVLQGTLHATALAGDAFALLGVLRPGDASPAQQRSAGTSALAAACAVDPQGRSALHCAAAAGHLQCVRLLLDAGADAGLADDVALETPLHAACLATASGVSPKAPGAAAAVARLLLASGSRLDASACNQSGHSPLDVALVSGHADRDAAALVATLCPAGADASDALKFLVTSSDASSPSSSASTAASSSGSEVLTSSKLALGPLTVKALLRHGAKPNLPVTSFNGPSTGAVPPIEQLLQILSQTPPPNLAGEKADDKATDEAAAGTPAARKVEEGSDGGKDTDGAASANELVWACLEALAGAGARLPSASSATNAKGSLPPPTRLSELLQGPAMEKVVQAQEAWTADNSAARRGTVMAHKAGWVPNKDSATCLHCPAKFSLLHRRHHCRFCAELVCGPCSCKQLALAGEPRQRACDRCFNRESEAPVAAPVDVVLPSGASSLAENQLSPIESPLLHSTRDGAADDSSTSPGSTTTTRGQTGDGKVAASALARATSALAANREQLQETSDKAGALHNAAANYGNLAAQLKNQAKSKNNKSMFW